MNVPSKNKFGKFWVLGCVANYAQHLDICRVSSETGFRAVRFNVVPLQIFFATALLTLTAFLNDKFDCLAAIVLSFACAAFPLWVLVATHLFATSVSRAFGRAVFSGSTASLANLKLLPASLASTLKKCFLFARFNFVRTLFGTGAGCRRSRRRLVLDCPRDGVTGR